MTKRPTILVVDDEIDVIESIKDLLRLEFEVVGAESADAGLAVLASRPVAVVMSDQRMPGTTGVEFLSRVKERYPDATRLLFTGFADLRAVIGAINEGSVYRYVAKPWDPDDLTSVLRDAVRRHELLTERDRLHAELRAAHDALRASEAQYRLLFERNPNPMWVVDVATGRIMAVNAATLRHYGYELDAMLTMRADDLELDAARDSAPPDVPHRPARHRRADGGVIEVELTAERVPSTAARPSW
ncbi:MAG: response regulator [Polyangiales bacterium]